MPCSRCWAASLAAREVASTVSALLTCALLACTPPCTLPPKTYRMPSATAAAEWPVVLCSRLPALASECLARRPSSCSALQSSFQMRAPRLPKPRPS
jgi:hypothetical protein